MAKVIKFRSRTGKTPEGQLLSNVKKILDVFRAQGLLTYRRIHVMPIIRGGAYTKNSDMQGMEDIQVNLLHGKSIHLELKSATASQTPEQKFRQKELTDLGHDYWVCRTVEDFIKGLRQRGLTVWCYPSQGE